MTQSEHARVTGWIRAKHKETGQYPSHEEILLRMLQEAQEVTYLDAVEYGLGSTFRSRLSDLRKSHSIISYDKSVPTRYGTKATVKAHRLGSPQSLWDRDVSSSDGRDGCYCKSAGGVHEQLA